MSTHTTKLRAGLVTPALYWGGAERWMLDLARFSTHAIDWTGCACVSPAFRDDTMAHLFEQLMPVRGFGCEAVRQVADGADVLIAWGNYDLAAMVEGFNGPVVFVGHGSGSFDRKAVRQAAHGATHHAAVAQAATVPFEGVVPIASVEVIYNGIDPNRCKQTVEREDTRRRVGVAPLSLHQDEHTQFQEIHTMYDTRQISPYSQSEPQKYRRRNQAVHIPAENPMTFHALVVDDDADILDEVKDRLESLGHTCDLAETQAEVRDLLKRGRFSYALLDLKIPVQHGRPCRIDNGKNLLREIRNTRGFEDVPIIVMSAHGHVSPKLAVEVMRHGRATDFVMKPFSAADPPLERVIHDALRVANRDRPGAKTHSQFVRDPDPPQPFERGEMVFSETRIELCGAKVCNGVGSGLMRAILDVLRGKDSCGQFVALSGEELAQRAGNIMTRQNDIADAVRRLRERIQKVLLEEAKIRCTRQDVITNDRRYGYRLSSKITVRDADDAGSDVESKPSVPGSGQSDVRNPIARQEWIISQLAADGGMRKGELLPGYKRRFGLSKSTLERDLIALRRRGVIRFDGEKRTGRWCRA